MEKHTFLEEPAPIMPVAMNRLFFFILAVALVSTGCQGATSGSSRALATRAVAADTPFVAATGALARATSAETPASSEATTSQPEPSDITTAAPRAAPNLDTTPTAETATANPPMTTAPPAPVLTPTVAGALISVTMSGQVGVLLDEFPAEMRERVAAAILQQPASAWEARARRQVRLTRHRLNFRDGNRPGKGQLPLPPSQLWSIALDESGPRRLTHQSHDLVVIDYRLTTTLLTDAASVAEAEPALAQVGGRWEEPFMFPVDPDLLLQRTGRACINDRGFPPDSVDSENTWYFYDFERTTCREVVAVRVGVVDSAIRFERLSWDNTLADAVRSGPVTAPAAPDLTVVGEGLNNHRIVYRYIGAGDCALQEGAVNSSGWRRLLLFDGTVYNVGGEALHIGTAIANSGIDDMFVYAPCHEHVHYNFFGDFFLRDQEQLATSKQAFCVQSTDRRSNNELSPLVHNYSCRFQGVQAGWVDEYFAGLNTQWMDITDLHLPAEGETVGLGFHFNPEQFLCEGAPRLDENGDTLWEPSGFTTTKGLPIFRPQCDFAAGWDANNEAVRNLFIPATGSFVTAPCSGGEMGPLRNCGFEPLTVSGVDPLCRAGQPVTLALRVSRQDQSQVVRVCEWSAALNTGVACAFEDSLANVIVSAQPASVSFTCPLVRDQGTVAATASASYALYVAPVWPEDEVLPLTTVE